MFFIFPPLDKEVKQHFKAFSFMFTGLGEKKCTSRTEYPWVAMIKDGRLLAKLHSPFQSCTGNTRSSRNLHTVFSYYIVAKYKISDAASVYTWKQARAVKTWIAISKYYRLLGSQVYHDQTQLTFTQMPWREYGVGTKWEWVNNDMIFIVQLKLFI